MSRKKDAAPRFFYDPYASLANLYLLEGLDEKKVFGERGSYELMAAHFRVKYKARHLTNEKLSRAARVDSDRGITKGMWPELLRSEHDGTDWIVFVPKDQGRPFPSQFVRLLKSKPHITDLDLQIPLRGMDMDLKEMAERCARDYDTFQGLLLSLSSGRLTAAKDWAAGLIEEIEKMKGKSDEDLAGGTNEGG